MAPSAPMWKHAGFGMSDVPLLAMTVNVHPCHGAPPLADDARWASELRVWGRSLGKPKDILMVSGVMARGMITGGSVPDVLTTGCCSGSSSFRAPAGRGG